MLGDDRTIRCLDGRDQMALNEHYLRQLVLVASHGSDEARRLFVGSHQATLGGYAGYLLHLSEEHLGIAFTDALTARQGSWPETLMGFRLAFPVHPPYRRADMWSLWRSLAEYRPAGLAVDPVCGMFVDPSEVRHTVRAGARTVYFCCPRCLVAYVPNTPDVTEIRRLWTQQSRELPTSA